MSHRTAASPASLLAALLALLVLTGWVAEPTPPSGALVLPVGGDGVTYDEPDGPDELPVGPSAVAVDASGTTWVLDVEAQRLVRAAADGTLLPPVDLTATGMSSLWDLDVRHDGFVVLGADPMGTTAFALLDAEGGVTAVHPMPASADLDQGLSGLAVVDGGAVLAELEGGVRLVQILDEDGQPDDEAVTSYRRHGHAYRIEPAGPWPGVVVDGRLIEVRVDHELVGIRWLGAAPDGTAWVVVEELRSDVDQIQVDQTVRRYAPDGRLLGATRVELTDRYTIVEHALTLGSDGTVWLLQTRPTHAEVVPLTMHERLPPLFPPPETIVQLAADDAVGTAVSLSVEAFPAGSVAHALVARDDVFADALASGGVQGMADAPLLLTGSGALDPRVLVELRRLGAARVTVLGGEAAVSAEVVTALRAEGLSVDRVAGDTRIQTAVALADAYAPTASRAVLVRADGGEATQAFADALAAGALAASSGDPVLLTATGHLAPSVRDYLVDAGVREVVIAGGESAISDAVLQELISMGIDVDRAGGGDRAATAVELARRRGTSAEADVARVILVDGHSWSDGLSAAALSARTDAPVLLTDGDEVPSATSAYLAALAQSPVMVCTPSVSPLACTAAAGRGQTAG